MLIVKICKSDRCAEVELPTMIPASVRQFAEFYNPGWRYVETIATVKR